MNFGDLTPYLTYGRQALSDFEGLLTSFFFKGTKNNLLNKQRTILNKPFILSYTFQLHCRIHLPINNVNDVFNGRRSCTRLPLVFVPVFQTKYYRESRAKKHGLGWAHQAIGP